MKKALLAALLVMVISSWCLAQTDSLPVPTPEDTIKAAPVAIKQAECPDKKWVLGFEATSLDLKALPGDVFLQRKVSQKLLVGASFSYNYAYHNPGEEYDADDSTRYNYESRDWSVNISPEIIYLTKITTTFNGGISLKASFSRSRYYSSNEWRTETYYYYYSTSIGESNSFDYSFSVPVFIERQFKIKKYPVALGISNNFIGMSSGWYKIRTKNTQEDYSTPQWVEENERIRQGPIRMNVDNPFQGSVRVYFKLFL
jgi:hypothetical protein